MLINIHEISGVVFIPILVAITFAVSILPAVISCRIFARAGYSGLMGLLMFIPVANVIALCVLAFGDWPIYQEIRQLRQRAGMVGGEHYR